MNSRRRREAALGYKAFTDRITAAGVRQPTGNHRFDQLCYQHGINHCLILIRRPQTNGMVERFNGRIAEVLATTPFYKVPRIYLKPSSVMPIFNNHHIPQYALGHQPPIKTLKEWQIKQPELVVRTVIDHTGPDT